MPVYGNINGASKEIKPWYVNINGTQTALKNIYANINGVQKPLYSSVYTWAKYTWSVDSSKTTYVAEKIDEMIERGDFPSYYEMVSWNRYSYIIGTGYELNSETGIFTLTGVQEAVQPNTTYWNIHYDYIIDGRNTSGTQVLCDGGFGVANGGMAVDDYSFWGANGYLQAVYQYYWARNPVEYVTSENINAYKENNIGINVHSDYLYTFNLFPYNPTYRFIG